MGLPDFIRSQKHLQRGGKEEGRGQRAEVSGQRSEIRQTPPGARRLRQTGDGLGRCPAKTGRGRTGFGPRPRRGEGARWGERINCGARRSHCSGQRAAGRVWLAGGYL